MGIGISFTGHDGRMQSANVDSLGEAKTLLDGMMQSAKEAVARTMLPRPGGGNVTNITNNYGRKRKGKGNAAPEAVKIDPMGSVEDSVFGIHLIGDRNAGLVRNGKLYGYSVAGLKGFWGLEEIDPPGNGPQIGDVGNDDEQEDKGEHAVTDKGAYSAMLVSRMLVAPVSPKNLSTKILWLFFRNVLISAGGRVVAVGGEQRKSLGMLTTDGEPEPKEDPSEPYIPTDPSDPDYPTPDTPNPEDEPEGLTGNVTVVRKVVYNENSNGKVQCYLKTMHYFKGRLTQVRNLPAPVDVFTPAAGADVSALNGLKLVTDFGYGSSTSFNLKATRNELIVANGVVSIKAHDNDDDRNVPTTPHSTSS